LTPPTPTPPPSPAQPPSSRTPDAWTRALHASITASLTRLAPLIAARRTDAFRLLSSAIDAPRGIDLDIYAHAAVMNVHEDAAPRDADHASLARTALDSLAPLNIRAVYLKPFARDRSRMGGQLPAAVTDPTPAAGEPIAEALTIRELDWSLEVRLYDGLSTGLFLDQRDNRAFVRQWCAARAGEPNAPTMNVLNTFAYTCAFSIAAATAGALTTSVDVSGRYLDWGKRNFALNAIDLAPHRFAKMDTFEFIAYSQRKSLRYDLIILDPPSFGSGSKKRGHKPWSSLEGFPRLIRESASLLNPRGVIFASTNTRELCQSDRLRREVFSALRQEPRWLTLPPAPPDFQRDRGRFAACAFELPSPLRSPTNYSQQHRPR